MTFREDGNYNATLRIRLEACDMVIFMDVSTWAALRGLVSRRLKHGYGQDQATGIYNRLHWGVLTYAATYRRRMRPRVLAKIDQYAGHAEVVFLRDRRHASPTPIADPITPKMIAPPSR
ncbi:hypothetical protein [Nonomuraea basaltis]|uniref:hypothetical protein n=1 Tax=Nonomuraea basaltis TaxID=2495887 RepID=UPI00110C559C|nr:hypothetical protein [Nonomuraea basaltis]TMR94868.1 hypothetical protein EJK15_31655 [Nonomuraea basaltis]